ncbi:MAG: OmpA family protein, partial [Burkholderiales bacterium]
MADTPAPKPAKPELMPYSEMTYVQGNSAFDPMNAVLKPEGRAELDKLVATLSKRAVQVNSIIVSGHVDRLEEAAGAKALSEERARAVKDYLVSKGVNEKAIFWEGKQA